MFNIEGMQTLLKTNGIEGVFAEPAVEYELGKRDIPDLGPKRVEEGKTEGGSQMSQDIINNYRAETEQYFQDICGMNSNENEYKPLVKVEELEEENYNQIDNNLSNTKPRSKERQDSCLEEKDPKKNMTIKERRSLLERIEEKKAAAEARKIAADAKKQRQNIPKKQHKVERTV